MHIAWFISTGVVEPLGMAEEFINETFKMFLDAMEISESDLIGANNLDAFLEIVYKEKQERDSE